MTPLHGIACFCDIGFGARAVSRKTPIYFILTSIDHFKFCPTFGVTSSDSLTVCHIHILVIPSYGYYLTFDQVTLV